jgi:hypothetical protein
MENKNWFSHVEWAVLLVTLLGGFYMLDGKIERQGQRTDRLYEMFCDIQQQFKDEMLKMNDRHNNFLDEQRKRHNNA